MVDDSIVLSAISLAAEASWSATSATSPTWCAARVVAVATLPLLSRARVAAALNSSVARLELLGLRLRHQLRRLQSIGRGPERHAIAGAEGDCRDYQQCQADRRAQRQPQLAPVRGERLILGKGDADDEWKARHPQIGAEPHHPLEHSLRAV